MALKLITPPSGEILTLAEAKSFLRVDHSDDDALIGTLIKAARLRIEGPEGKLNAAFLTQTWDLILDSFPPNEIMLPLHPVQSVDEIVYFDDDGVETTQDPSSYYLDEISKPQYVIPMSDTTWPSVLDAANAMRVRFTVGFPWDSGEGIADNVPEPVKIAVMQLVLHWYDRRALAVDVGSILEPPEFVWSLLQPYKMFL